MMDRVLHRKTDAYNWTIDVVDEDTGAVLAPHTRCVDGVITVFMFGAWHGPECNTENTDLRARVAELEAAAIDLSEALRVARADAAAKAQQCRELRSIIEDIKQRAADIVDLK